MPRWLSLLPTQRHVPSMRAAHLGCECCSLPAAVTLCYFDSWKSVQCCCTCSGVATPLLRGGPLGLLAGGFNVSLQQRAPAPAVPPTDSAAVLRPHLDPGMLIQPLYTSSFLITFASRAEAPRNWSRLAGALPPGPWGRAPCAWPMITYKRVLTESTRLIRL